MHDPMTLIYSCRFFDLWHVDPEKDGTDDSCGWFQRSRHGSKDVLERIVKRYEFEWDRIFDPNQRDDDEYDEPRGRRPIYFCGLFKPDGSPHFSVPGVVLNLFFMAACEYFDSNGHTNWKRARRWMNQHLFDILFFAENTTDSLFDDITRKFEIGCGEEYTKRRRDERIRTVSSCIYAWILRAERPWWKHPRWHVWHWKLNVTPILHFKRWMFSRCARCGKGFRWGESPVTYSWEGSGPLWLRSEKGIYHANCIGVASVNHERPAV